MILIPRCYERECKFFIGVLQPDETESSEMVVCQAFTKGIPDEIAYGDNLHLKPLPGQKNDIVYEKSP